MKITNKKSVEAAGAFLLCIIPLILMVMIYQLMIFKNAYFFLSVCSIILVILMLSLGKLKYIEFENSGFVVTFKKKRALSKSGFTAPVFEFPLDLLTATKIKNKKLYLYVNSKHSNPGKIHTFTIDLGGFTKDQAQNIVESLNTPLD